MNEKINPHFYNFLAEGNIVCGLNGANRDDAIEELVKLLARNNAGVDAESVLKSVLERENVLPTAIAPGLAVPHARLDNISDMIVALGTTTAGLEFGMPGLDPVHVIILILTPKDDPGLHLQVLAGLAKDFRNSEIIRKVAAMESPLDIMSYFSEAQVRIADYLMARDVMNSSPITLLESDTLKTAIHTFATSGAYDIPLLDEDGDLRGALSLENILKFSLPEHLLWMNDLSAIQRFQPFAAMLRDDQGTKLADISSGSGVTVDEELPAIQLAKMFCTSPGLRQIIVTRNGKPVGVVNLKNFITKLFWA